MSKRDGSSGSGSGSGDAPVFEAVSDELSPYGALQVGDLSNERLFALRDAVNAEIAQRVADCSDVLNRAGAKRKRAPRAKKVTP